MAYATLRRLCAGTAHDAIGIFSTFSMIAAAA